MAKGSDSGWQGFPSELRVCGGCGEKLTLRDAPLWIQLHPHRQVFHWEHRDARIDLAARGEQSK